MSQQDWLNEYEEGQLSIDVIDTGEDILIEAPVAGVKLEDLDVEISHEVVTIRGKRLSTFTQTDKNYLVSECYWGNFSRTFVLPIPIDSTHAEAILSKDGILQIRLPKANQGKSHSLKIKHSFDSGEIKQSFDSNEIKQGFDSGEVEQNSSSGEENLHAN